VGRVPALSCVGCGQSATLQFVKPGPLCQNCMSLRIEGRGELPPLPEVPGPVSLSGPDVRLHTLAFVRWFTYAGLAVMMQEVDPLLSSAAQRQQAEAARMEDPGWGYQFSVVGPHDAAVGPLVERLQELAAREIGHHYLQLVVPDDDPDSPTSSRILVTENCVRGRLISTADGARGLPYSVVVDGRPVSWSELGHALEAFEGCRLMITVQDGTEMISESDGA
jgi:hypothetical protein